MRPLRVRHIITYSHYFAVFGGCASVHSRYNADAEVSLPYYTKHMRDVLEEIGIPDVKAYRIRVDQYVQEILGTRDLDPDRVWALLQPKLQDPNWREDFVKQLREKWEQRDWRNEGL